MEISITDIQQTQVAATLLAGIEQGLTSSPKTLPSLLLWDEKGHELFKKITESQSYYGTGADGDIAVQHMDQLCDLVGTKGILIELGSGYSFL